MKVFFIMTNFNNSPFTNAAIKSIFESDLKDVRIVIVDNASNERDANKLSELESENVKVIYSDKNVGYFPGLNLGIDYIKNDLDENSVVYIGNNDIIFPKNMGEELSSINIDLKTYPVISPDIRTLDGDAQNPHVISRISKIRNLIYDIYHLNYSFACIITTLADLTRKWTQRGDEKEYKYSQEIYQGYGAMYILTPLYFENFNKLPEDSFLMYEEFFLSNQLREKGFKVFYQPKLSLVHCCKGATGQIPGKLKWAYSKIAHKKYRKILKGYEE